MVPSTTRFSFRDVHQESDVFVEVCPHMLDFSGRYEESYYEHWILDVSPILKRKQMELMVICKNCQQPVAAPSYTYNFWLMRTRDILGQVV